MFARSWKRGQRGQRRRFERRRKNAVRVCVFLDPLLLVARARPPRTRFLRRRLPKKMGAWCRIEPKVTSRTAPIAAKMPSDVTISLSETSKCTQASASSHPTLARGGGDGGGGDGHVAFAVAIPPDLHRDPVKASTWPRGAARFARRRPRGGAHTIVRYYFDFAGKFFKGDAFPRPATRVSSLRNVCLISLQNHVNWSECEPTIFYSQLSPAAGCRDDVQTTTHNGRDG